MFTNALNLMNVKIDSMNELTPSELIGYCEIPFDLDEGFTDSRRESSH